VEENKLVFDGMIGSLDGKKILRGHIHGEPAQCESIGNELAKSLFESGGREILKHIRIV
jgi:porphobilinogen deaminase